MCTRRDHPGKGGSERGETASLHNIYLPSVPTLVWIHQDLATSLSNSALKIKFPLDFGEGKNHISVKAGA